MVNRICFNKLKNYFIYFYVDDLYGDFKEAAITFSPTYKFDLRGDGDTYAKHRTPSYTVRIKTENKMKLLIKTKNKEERREKNRYEDFIDYLFPSIIDLTNWKTRCLFRLQSILLDFTNNVFIDR